MTSSRPRLIAAVATPEDAKAAILGGADVIETGDPALLPVLRELADGRAKVMLRLGPERASSADPVADWIGMPVPVHGGAEQPQILEAAKRRFAIVFADKGLADVPAGTLPSAGFTDVLVDVSRDGSGLLAHVGMPELRRLTDAFRGAGLGVAFAGALEAPDVTRLRVLKPDAFLFDAALRKNGIVDAAAVGAIAALLRAEPVSAIGETDRIFVRDHVVEMEIGAYGHERGRRQRVRFTAEVEVPRSDRRAGMGGVYSYDLVTDAIAMLAAGAHVDFVETLAEELAEAILVDPRVDSVFVRVEKLDLGPGCVGIEIRRTR